ncbi:MAG: Fic family protein [Treponema sp.]|nr:Fic family protein [Candidatus Treponema caballi]
MVDNYQKLLQELTEAQKLVSSRCPFDENQLPQLKKIYKAECTWSSNAIEGNTISLVETELILNNGITIHGHTLNEINECVGHGNAFDYMFSLINSSGITENDIKRLHFLFAKDIRNIPCPGEYRDVSKSYVYITGSSYSCPDFEKVPELMTELVEWSNIVGRDLHPVELASEFHRKFVYIHPFPDGNGRVARLCMNMLLLQNHYLPVLITPKLRSSYVKKLENGRISPTVFDEFIAIQEAKQLVRFMKLLNMDPPENLLSITRKTRTGKSDKSDDSLRGCCSL